VKVNSAIRGLFTFAWELVVLLVIFPALETITSGPGAGALSVVGGVAGGALILLLTRQLSPAPPPTAPPERVGIRLSGGANNTVSDSEFGPGLTTGIDADGERNFKARRNRFR